MATFVFPTETGISALNPGQPMKFCSHESYPTIHRINDIVVNHGIQPYVTHGTVSAFREDLFRIEAEEERRDEVANEIFKEDGEYLADREYYIHAKLLTLLSLKRVGVFRDEMDNHIERSRLKVKIYKQLDRDCQTRIAISIQSLVMQRYQAGLLKAAIRYKDGLQGRPDTQLFPENIICLGFQVMASINHRETLEMDLANIRTERARLEHEIAKFPADENGDDDLFALEGSHLEKANAMGLIQELHKLQPVTAEERECYGKVSRPPGARPQYNVGTDPANVKQHLKY